MKLVSLSCLLFLMLLLSSGVRADRDIVYSARYYLPPGSRGTSHFHLYRVNPDGTGRTQITFGSADDNDPHWSPDGRRVLFTREHQGDEALYVMRANGSRPVRLWRSSQNDWLEDYHWSPNGRMATLLLLDSVLLMTVDTRQSRRLPNAEAAYWSPDGKTCYVASTQGPDRLMNLRTGQETKVTVETYGVMAYRGQKVVWLGKNTLVGIASKPEQAWVSLTMFDTAGKVVRTTPCHWPHSETDPFLDSVDPGSRSLQPLSFDALSVIYAQDVGNSGDRPSNSYWRVNTRTGKMKEITGGQFLVWSRGGNRFCTASTRELATYGDSKSLYVSSLDIGSAAHPEQTRTIVGGLVWVTGADWRGGTGRKAGRT